MRDAFCRALRAAANKPEFVFLTGDLGYRALEPLRDAMGARFINAGVAEQNMVGVAAALAREGLRPWAYSIAPFIYARPFEQIRNDVCLHDLPVVLVGNGGGYGYGVMGATHHALEDYGSLLALPNMHVFVPAFDEDLPPMAESLFRLPHPAYLRLGVAEKCEPVTIPPYAPWRKLLSGKGPTLLAIGPLAGGIAAAVHAMELRHRPNFWLVSELPLAQLPEEFLADLRHSGCLIVVEEHVANGGLGCLIGHRLLTMGCAPRRFVHRFARGYISGTYGSQKFHRRECGLDPQSLVNLLQAKE